MQFGNPVHGKVYKLGAAHPAKYFAVTQPYGCTGFPWEPPLGNCAHFNRGLDIARGPAGCGDDVLACADGVVLWSGPLNDGNQAIVIHHGDGHATGYGHNSKRTVSKGQKVKQGDKIGEVGATGLATGCHVDLTYKTDFPASGDVNEFYWDPGKGGKGKWADIWPRLTQNIPAPKTVTLRNLDEIRIRNGSNTSAKAYAETRKSRVVRISDGDDLGPLGPWKYGGKELGGAWKVTLPDGKIVIGSEWVKLLLSGRYRYAASALTVVE